MRRIFIQVLFGFLFFSALILFPSENSVIYLRNVDSTTPEPSQSEELFSSEVIANIFEGLVRFKKKEPMRLSPVWPSDGSS
jgi:ABC-type oligopeptide transport system substrate-binding subunit